MRQALTNPLIFPAVGNSLLFFLGLLYNFILTYLNPQVFRIVFCGSWGVLILIFIHSIHRDFRWKELVDWTVGVE